MVLIDKAALLNKIAKEVHYDSEHSLEMYAKMLSLINDAPEAVVRCKDCESWGLNAIKKDEKRRGDIWGLSSFLRCYTKRVLLCLGRKERRCRD